MLLRQWMLFGVVVVLLWLVVVLVRDFVLWGRGERGSLGVGYMLGFSGVYIIVVLLLNYIGLI